MATVVYKPRDTRNQELAEGLGAGLKTFSIANLRAREAEAQRKHEQGMQEEKFSFEKDIRTEIAELEGMLREEAQKRGFEFNREMFDRALTEKVELIMLQGDRNEQQQLALTRQQIRHEKDLLKTRLTAAEKAAKEARDFAKSESKLGRDQAAAIAKDRLNQQAVLGVEGMLSQEKIAAGREEGAAERTQKQIESQEWQTNEQELTKRNVAKYKLQTARLYADSTKASERTNVMKMFEEFAKNLEDGVSNMPLAKARARVINEAARQLGVPVPQIKITDKGFFFEVPSMELGELPEGTGGRIPQPGQSSSSVAGSWNELVGQGILEED